jgi:hypothetical protein
MRTEESILKELDYYGSLWSKELNVKVKKQLEERILNLANKLGLLLSHSRDDIASTVEELSWR